MMIKINSEKEMPVREFLLQELADQIKGIKNQSATVSTRDALAIKEIALAMMEIETHCD